VPLLDVLPVGLALPALLLILLLPDDPGAEPSFSDEL
jgi:hypothetical protein